MTPGSNGVPQFTDPDSPLSLGLQTAPWPSKYKPVSLPKYNSFGNSRQFLMSYEAAVASAGGDDVALAKSFIISCVGPVLNWYSLLPAHSVYIWIDLKTKFLQTFQVFHNTIAKTADLYNLKQKDKEPLASYVQRFMQLKSQVPNEDDKSVISAIVNGLTPGQTASHLSREEPRTLEELFSELEKYIKSDEDHRRRVAKRNQSRQNHIDGNW